MGPGKYSPIKNRRMNNAGTPIPALRDKTTFWRRRGMKAVRMVEVDKPLELQEIPIPSIGEEDILVRIRAAGICHSDAHYRAGKSAMGKLPITLGHEIAGEVESVGSQVTTIKQIGRASCRERV